MNTNDKTKLQPKKVKTKETRGSVITPTTSKRYTEAKLDKPKETIDTIPKSMPPMRATPKSNPVTPKQQNKQRSTNRDGCGGKLVVRNLPVFAL